MRSGTTAASPAFRTWWCVGLMGRVLGGLLTLRLRRVAFVVPCERRWLGLRGDVGVRVGVLAEKDLACGC